MGAEVIACDYCEDKVPLVEGWHEWYDPEGVEGKTRVPCPRAHKRGAPTKFHGVLLKPLANQHDRDGYLIDPQGVTFDPDKDYAISPDFDPRKLPVGRARVRRAEDGSLEAYGTLEKWPGAKLAIGVSYGRVRPLPTPGIVEKSQLMELGATLAHVDLEQPSVAYEE